MPNPDPTHPKFLEGDEGLSPVRNDDDVEGHMHAMNHPAEDEAGPEGFMAMNIPDELGAGVTDDDVEGHLRSFNQPADDEAEPSFAKHPTNSVPQSRATTPMVMGPGSRP